MKTKYRKKFLADLAGIPSGRRKAIETFVFKEVPQLESLGSSGKIERMKDYKSCYKARFGPYRVGLSIENDIVTFERVLDRKEIYRFFP